jgi:uncharacterized protein YbjT (DUF2867 family)
MPEKTESDPQRGAVASLSCDERRAECALCGPRAASIIIRAVEILLTGASGFVGSQLLPELLRDGHAVRAMTRDPARLRAQAGRSSRGLQVVRGDAVSGDGLRRALAGVELAYYLIHSMEPGAGGRGNHGFVERELLAAENFAQVARAAGVRRIVYLGGLVPRWSSRSARSRHLESREAVESVLLSAVPDSLALRASIVIGAGSRSFRLLVRLVERMPVLALPSWERFRTQPIDERDVIAMLRAAVDSPISGEVLEVGGPDVLSYGEMLERIADAMLIGRPAVRMRVSMTPLAGRLAAAIAAEHPELVLPLMEGLQGDLIARDDRAAERLGVRLHSFDSAVAHALAEWERAEPLAAR